MEYHSCICGSDLKDQFSSASRGPGLRVEGLCMSFDNSVLAYRVRRQGCLVITESIGLIHAQRRASPP